MCGWRRWDFKIVDMLQHEAYHSSLLGVVLIGYYLLSVTLRICRVEVWSRPFLSPVHNLVGGRGPVFLGGRVMELGLSMICR